ncbi:hypothetical protein Dsin_021856 [Dipteronia sinensis]|uniref:Uncharacterized protein n=1 Tax=Dipteronia sinensis TaxID=43782 RepID=A0AAE0A1W7_9ROSI|nr:hypothetical protein Dsin_021856 [Dipteronia sinensis]
MGLSGMCLRFLLLQMLLLMVANAALNTSQLAKPMPGCVRKCGDLKIPYPFGTNDSCSLNKHFLITCNNTKAFWGTNNSNFIVTNISMEGQFHGLSVVSYDCKNNDRSGASLCVGDFSISETQNKFTVIGCESYGSIHGKLDGKDYSDSCSTSCASQDNVIDGSCSAGSGCCQKLIPERLRDIIVYANVSEFSPCSYAFVIEDSQFNFSSSNLSNKIERVPTVVDWSITGNGSCTEANLCKENALCKDADPTGRGSGYLCQCKDGYKGNPYLSHGCKCEKGCKNNLLLIALVVGLGSVMLLVGSYGTYYEFRKRRLIKLKQYFFDENGGSLLEQQLSEPGGTGDTATIFPTNELEQATNNFNEEKIIGRGRNGAVYKGILKDNNQVAIKKSNKAVGRSQTEPFINQVKVLSKINHRNVVKLLGCCLETEVPLLVYEFVTNGSLFDHIHKKNNTPTISWETRLRIAAETAGVLSYLHSDSATPVIHRDVKSSNILLDDNFTPKVTDFGPSNLVPMDVTQLSTMVEDTLGYLDPEYMHTGQFTEKSDVYSFGVVLVELMTGKQAVSFDRPEEDRRLVVKFSSLLKKGRLSRILDNGIINNDNTNQQIKYVAELANRCLNVKGEERPSMKEVAMELERLRHSGDNDEGGTEEIKQLRSETSYMDNCGDGYNSTTKYYSMKDQVDGETEDFV